MSGTNLRCLKFAVVSESTTSSSMHASTHGWVELAATVAAAAGSYPPGCARPLARWGRQRRCAATATPTTTAAAADSIAATNDGRSVVREERVVGKAGGEKLQP